MEWRVMVAASLLHYLRVGSGTAGWVVLAIALIALGLLAYVVLAGVQTSDLSPADPQLLGPFRWAKPVG